MGVPLGLPLQADSTTNCVVYSRRHVGLPRSTFIVASYHFRFSLDAKTVTGTDQCQSTNMLTLIFPFRCRSFYHITRLESVHSLDGLRIGKCTILFLLPESITAKYLITKYIFLNRFRKTCFIVRLYYQ